MGSSTNQILIPVNFSEQALIAIDQSYNLARFYNAELTLLYVIDSESDAYKPSEGDIIKKQMEAKLEELGSTVSKKHNIKVNTIVAKGSISEKILEIAEMIKAKMIIMGKSSSKDPQKKAVGSNALKVVEGAKCPVVTIKGKMMRDGCKNIVLPIDLTKESIEKVTYAIELGKLYGATIRVVSVLFSQSKPEVRRLTMQMEQATFLIKSEVDCTSELIKAPEGQTLGQVVVDYANKVQADLIMIMTQQEPESRIIPLSSGAAISLDSDAHDIINNSDIPVMSIVPTLKLQET